MDIEVKGMDDLMRGIDGMAVQVQAAAERALKATAKTIWTVAKQNAPRSPSSGQIKANRKTNRKTKRKPTATSRPAPGGLERSISYEVFGSKEASIFVPSNSEAGTYAEFIHDCRVPGARPIIRGPRGGEKRAKGPAGTWSNLGIGSVAKMSGGKEVGEKFIGRAFQKHSGLLGKKLKQELDKVKL